MVSKLSIDNFLLQSPNHPVIDVRAPKEFLHGHIPGAINLPLFTDEERAAVGTLYKQQGREQAMMLGLEYYGKNMQRIISDLKNYSSDKQLFIHCWRGGMRSGVVSWMLDLWGYKVFTLQGGYKSFRRTVLDSFSVPKNILILGGKTGSAKTEILTALKNKNEQTVDLENLAHHKGSAFGAIGETAPPTQEQFENNLFFEFKNSDAAKPIWLEDESQRIGTVNIPNDLWIQMRNAKVMYVEIPFEERLKYIVEHYGKFDIEQLKAATIRVQKRLGGLETKNALQFFDEGNFVAAFSILLRYYDKFYQRATDLRKQETIERIAFEFIDPLLISERIMTTEQQSTYTK
ncbi:MAG: tRNA 2-selenouridine(34) synthase MnmH [Chitinophagales bacterium]|nr:tRNA 2-selenouridine(34) synthase MnmH [Chitinophagales bacterium]